MHLIAGLVQSTSTPAGSNLRIGDAFEPLISVFVNQLAEPVQSIKYRAYSARPSNSDTNKRPVAVWYG
jgi:hypothetical protein